MSIINKIKWVALAILVLSLTSFMGVQKKQHSKNHVFSGKMLNPIQSIVQKTVLDSHTGLIRFEAQIGANSFNISQVHYSWILPENVRLVSGDLEGDLVQLKPDEGQLISLEVQGYNLEQNENTILRIERLQGAQKLANHFVVPSREELTEEYKKLPSQGDVNNLSSVNTISKIRSISSQDGSIAKKLVY